jgi:hypothetical protein
MSRRGTDRNSIPVSRLPETEAQRSRWPTRAPRFGETRSDAGHLHWPPGSLAQGIKGFGSFSVIDAVIPRDGEESSWWTGIRGRVAASRGIV